MYELKIIKYFYQIKLRLYLNSKVLHIALFFCHYDLLLNVNHTLNK